MLTSKTNKIVILRKKPSKIIALEGFRGSIHYDSITSKSLKKKYKEEKEESWEKERFNNICDTTLYSYNNDLSNYIKLNKLKLKKEIYIYSFSDVIEFSKTVKFFRVQKGYSNQGIYDKIVVYQKSNGNWQKIEEIDNSDLY